MDGIVTLDLDAVRHLVKALGSISVAGVDTPITAENVEQELVQLWEQPANQTAHPTEATGGARDWWSQRKDFVPQVAGAALAKLQAGDFDAAALTAEITRRWMGGRSRCGWISPNWSRCWSNRAGMVGCIRRRASDFLAVVDSNVGYNKVDAAMQRQLQYEVSWPQGADRTAEVTADAYLHAPGRRQRIQAATRRRTMARRMPT